MEVARLQGVVEDLQRQLMDARCVTDQTTEQLRKLQVCVCVAMREGGEGEGGGGGVYSRVCFIAESRVL